MKILVTAFEPFDGDERNSSLMVLDKIGNKVGDAAVEKLVLPTPYGECADIAFKKAVETGVDAVLCLGQAGGRKCITAEVIGINYAYAKISDNKGVKKDGVKLLQDGADALFSTLPVKEMVKSVKDAGFEAELSLSAGGFVCNSLLYMLLEKVKREGQNILVGFVHLPYEKSQGKEGFAMSADEMSLCVEEMIKTIYRKGLE